VKIKRKDGSRGAGAAGGVFERKRKWLALRQFATRKGCSGEVVVAVRGRSMYDKRGFFPLTHFCTQKWR
jgi:hypothetical protein